MASTENSGQNIGELIRQGISLTTREVLAVVHEVCRDAAAAFPRSVDELWITDTGELLIERSDRVAEPLDPRAGAAALLEVMLPAEGADDPARVVPAALRGLPSRLRAATESVGPQGRRDLMSILAWHLAADPREVVQQLAQRVFRPQPHAPIQRSQEELELFPEAPPEPPRSRSRIGTVFALIAMAFLLIAIGSASYWFFRDNPDRPERLAQATEPSSEPPSEPPSEPSSEPPSEPSSEPPSEPSSDPPSEPPSDPPSEPKPLGLPVQDGAFSPAFAATGRELFFHAGRSNGRLLVANLDDSGQVSRVSAVREDGARDYHPRVSPDGRWIAFDSDRDGERGVYVAARDGSNLQRVSGAGYAAVPSWSPDMKRLAFIRGETSRPRVWNLWLRDLATGALQRHTSFRSGQVWGASWFPDGATLAYSHDEQLVISHLDAREDIIIDSPKRGHLVRTPAVSPDGRSIVFQVFKDGVWLFDVRSRSMRRILDDPTAEEFAWSPDGARVAYHSRRDGAWKIWVMPI